MTLHHCLAPQHSPHSMPSWSRSHPHSQQTPGTGLGNIRSAILPGARNSQIAKDQTARMGHPIAFSRASKGA